MGYEINQGKISKAQKVVIYGPEGIGKSTFLSQFPGVVFIDTEGSTNQLDVRRFPAPTSWTMLLEIVKSAIGNKNIGTLALDTADWAEMLTIQHICAKSKVSGIEDFGYGKGYTYLEEEFGRLLNLFSEVIDSGVNVAIAAHAQMRKFEQPDETGAYDRWELKLEKKTAALLKEWADIVLFANYETIVIKGKTPMDKNKVSGGSRVMYTTHHACWDAKNRHGLAEKLPFDFTEIAHCIPSKATATTPVPTPETRIPEAYKTEPDPKFEEVKGLEINPFDDTANYLKPLCDLMLRDQICEDEIRKAVASRGYYPEDTEIENYDPAFISGMLVASWEQVKNIIYKNRESEGKKA
jgi:GTPase SAR1 family protein